jgi:hypothetical protein
LIAFEQFFFYFVKFLTFSFRIVPGYEHNNQSEEDDTRPTILDHELHMMHRNVPALRRAGIDTNTIKQVGSLLNFKNLSFMLTGFSCYF